MFTFGYKLRLVKKSDLKEYRLFEKAVFTIQKQSNDLGQWLYDGFPLNEDTLHQLTVDVEGLHTYIDIYFNNKYSLPSSSMLMFQKIDVLRKSAGNMVDVVAEVDKIERIKSQIDSGVVPPNLEFDPDEFIDTYQKAMEAATAHVKKLTAMMLKALNGIMLVIESDLLKLIMGVDIMKEYKKRCKRLPKDKDLSTEFFVHFKAVTKDDRRFLEKERNKNERS